ncbi:FUSC family protein [Streptomyces sp. MST-110588]|uniref:FUSC family protein n=1 Tax=Streptomyces sp. MST-110588 TaxID=2833628 RepID=UPI002049F01B|nr:FUSC family protein [Streptomyces sp. MST-110588]UNO43048.1 FUSC family protein [Streptomyces sp. MST-110588]
MGKHATPAAKDATPATARTRGVRVRPLPVKSTVRLRRPVDIWHKPALSAVAALAVPDFTLLALGRLDLILYTSAGAMCALYAHGLPYAARARVLLWVILGMVASLGVALTAASLVASTAFLVALASLTAAVHKVMCDATRIGPPGNLILTFIAASAFFVPQRIGQVPCHLSLALAAGAFAWLVCMAPALIRPHGPQRIAVARALEAAATLLRTDPSEAAPARHATAAAVNAAWHTLFLTPARAVSPASAISSAPARPAVRPALDRLLLHAESALAVRHAPGPEDAGRADRCAAWARDLRRNRPLPGMPAAPLTAAQADELTGIAAEHAARHSDAYGTDTAYGMDETYGADAAYGASTAPGADPAHAAPRRPAPDHPRGLRAVLTRLAPGSPLLPIGARVAVSCVLAGWCSMAAGVGHPYWAVVTAASVHQANTTLSWQRALQRTLGNFLGLLVFTALLPLIHTGPLAMILLALVCQLGAEACITRNYWLGTVWVTPMALLLTEFGSHLPARTLITDRWTDTVLGAAVGLACCVLVTNRRAGDRVEAALTRLAVAQAAALRLLEAGHAPGGPRPDALETDWARDRLCARLLELREAVEVAAGEWWQRALPEERVALAEQEGHRTLARLVRHLSAVPAGPPLPPSPDSGPHSGPPRPVAVSGTGQN